MDLLDSTISEDQLSALYALWPEVLKDDLYSVKFSKQLRAFSDFLHPPGKKDIRTTNEFDGLTVCLNLGDRLGRDIYYNFIQEQKDYDLFMTALKPGDIVVDIGANFGMYSLGAAKRLASLGGKVLAIEPDERSFSLLKENIKFNKFNDVIYSLKTCVGAYDGKVKFYSATDPSFSGIFDTNRSKIVDILSVPIDRLDSIMSQYGLLAPNKIKIDVEGAEYAVLDGALALLKKFDVMIMLEISSKNIDDERIDRMTEIFRQLEEHGYISLFIDNQADAIRLVVDTEICRIQTKQKREGTINYFLVKSDGKELQYLKDAFKVIDLNSKYKAGLNKALIHLKEHTSEAINFLETSIWAAGVERRICINEFQKNKYQIIQKDKDNDDLKVRLAEKDKDNTDLKLRLAKIQNELDCINSGFLSLLIALKKRFIAKENIF